MLSKVLGSKLKYYSSLILLSLAQGSRLNLHRSSKLASIRASKLYRRSGLSEELEAPSTRPWKLTNGGLPRWSIAINVAQRSNSFEALVFLLTYNECYMLSKVISGQGETSQLANIVSNGPGSRSITHRSSELHQLMFIFSLRDSTLHIILKLWSPNFESQWSIVCHTWPDSWVSSDTLTQSKESECRWHTTSIVCQLLLASSEVKYLQLTDIVTNGPRSRTSPSLTFRVGSVGASDSSERLDPPYNYDRSVDLLPFGQRSTEQAPKIDEGSIGFLGPLWSM